MKKNVFEQGYALITVLLIITILMVIILSVMGASFNTVKQNQTVEKNSQSVALAEMGVSFYQNMIKNIYLNSKDSVSQTIQEEINNDQRNGTLKQDQQYIKEASVEMIGVIRSAVQTYIVNNTDDGQGKKIVDSSNALYNVKLVNPPDLAASPASTATVDNSMTLAVTGYAQGDSDGNTLSTTITVLPSVQDEQIINENSPFLSLDLSANVNKAQLKKCSSLLDNLGNPINTLNLSNVLGSLLGILKNNNVSLDELVSVCPTTDVLLDGTLNINQNENNMDFQGKIFYILNGDLTLNSINSLTNVIFHTDQSLTIVDNSNNAAGATLEANVDATFKKHMELQGLTQKKSNTVTPSHLYVGNNLIADMGLNLSDGSTAYIGGDATVDNGLDLADKSTAFIGVKEKTTIDSLNLQSGSIAYISGDAIIGTNGNLTNPGAYIRNLTMDTDALLCVKGILKVDANINIQNKNIYTPDTDIHNKCGFNSQTVPKISFMANTLSTAVNYNYYPK